jgi:hypothetical protein
MFLLPSHVCQCLSGFNAQRCKLLDHHLKNLSTAGVEVRADVIAEILNENQPRRDRHDTLNDSGSESCTSCVCVCVCVCARACTRMWVQACVRHRAYAPNTREMLHVPE